MRPAGRVPNCRRYVPVGGPGACPGAFEGGECPVNVEVWVGRAAPFINKEFYNEFRVQPSGCSPSSGRIFMADELGDKPKQRRPRKRCIHCRGSGMMEVINIDRSVEALPCRYCEAGVRRRTPKPCGHCQGTGLMQLAKDRRQPRALPVPLLCRRDGFAEDKSRPNVCLTALLRNRPVAPQGGPAAVGTAGEPAPIRSGAPERGSWPASI